MSGSSEIPPLSKVASLDQRISKFDGLLDDTEETNPTMIPSGGLGLDPSLFTDEVSAEVSVEVEEVDEPEVVIHTIKRPRPQAAAPQPLPANEFVAIERAPAARPDYTGALTFLAAFVVTLGITYLFIGMI
jgi:hypothetical protein